MQITRRIVFVFLAVVLALGGCQLDTGVKVIKMGHAQVVSHPVHNAMVFLGRRLEEKSGGRIKVKVYPNQQLGTERELVELLQIGSLGMTKVSAASLEASSAASFSAAAAACLAAASAASCSAAPAV